MRIKVKGGFAGTFEAIVISVNNNKVFYTIADKVGYYGSCSFNESIRIMTDMNDKLLLSADDIKL